MALPAASPRLLQEEPCLPAAAKQLRYQLAAAVRSINWTYAIFWSVSSNDPGVLTWTDGFYNGEVKTRKIANSADELSADQLLMQRSELLRELYTSLLSGECEHRAARPVAALSPDELGDTEWYYVICMTYAFRPGQGLPGRSFVTNEHIWLCNAHHADSKTFSRAVLGKSASVQTIVCIPLMGGVLELGTTDSVKDNPDLVSRVTTTFLEPQFPACTEEEPCSSPSENETGGEADVVTLFEDLDHAAMETMVVATGQKVGEVEILPNASLEHDVTNEIGELYSLCDQELDVQPQPVEDDVDWILELEEHFETTPCFTKTAPPAAGGTDDIAGVVVTTPVVDRITSFIAWTGTTDSDDGAAAVPVVIGEPQKLLKKVVAASGAYWENSGGGGGIIGNATRSTQLESSIKNHVMSERKRREKLNDMFLILKSLVPTIHKVDKASILAETISHVKELRRRVEELESISCSWEHNITTRPSETIRLQSRGRSSNGGTIIEKSASKRKRASDSELISVMSDNNDAAESEREEHHWVLSKDGTSNVTVTVTDRDVLLEVHCQWEELLMTRVFDAIKTLRLDVLSVEASTPDGFMGLKIRAQSAGSAAIVPRLISEAVRQAIGKK